MSNSANLFEFIGVAIILWRST